MNQSVEADIQCDFDLVTRVLNCVWTICESLSEEDRIIESRCTSTINCFGSGESITLQLDFNLPGRLGAQYVDEDGTRKTPVMLHRAILGSFERFLGILIEHYAGAMPLWLAPQQAVLMTITDAQRDYALDLEQRLQKNGLRVKADLRNEKIGFKIRAHTLSKVPYLLVVGDKEVETGTVAVRTLSGEDLGSLSIDALSGQLLEAEEQRGRTQVSS